MTLMHFNDTDAATLHRERARATRYPQQVYTFELQLIGKQVTADCQLDRSQHQSGQFIRKPRIMLSALVFKHIINLYASVRVHSYIRSRDARAPFGAHVNSIKSTDDAHSKKPALQINHSNVARCPALRKKESTRRDRLFRDRRYIFLQQISNYFNRARPRDVRRTARDRRFSNFIGIVSSLLNIFFVRTDAAWKYELL